MLITQIAGKESQRQTPLQYGVSVALKLVQVYVTDKGGKPITDLTKYDFTVFDNGRQVAITDFEKHVLGPVPPDAEATAKEERPVPKPTEPQTINRKYILFFDFAFNTPKGVAAGVKAALDFLDKKAGPQDETALLSYSMLKGLKVHEFLTSDHAKVRKAVAAVTAKEISGRADEVEQAYWQMVEILGSDRDGGLSVELSRMEMQRQDSTRQAQNYLLGLTSLARALRLVQGQKNVILFSTGVPASLINASRGAGTDVKISEKGAGGKGGVFSGSPSTGSQFQVGNSVLRPLQEILLKELSASNCSIYAFDTRDSSKVASLFAYDEMAFMTRLGGMFGADGVHQTTSDQFRNDKTTGMDSLRRLSKQTGGRYYSNIGFYEKNLEEVSDITGTYYVLGYSIPSSEDGKFHNIKVEVKRNGSQVRAQRGYFNPKPFREYTVLEKKLHLFDLALNGRSDLHAPMTIPMSALAYGVGEKARVRSVARIPKAVWEEFGGGTAEFVALFFDERDNLLGLERSVVPTSAHRGQDLVFTGGASAQPGRVKCRTVIRDLDTGQSAVGTGVAYIGKPAETGLSVFSPLLLVPAAGTTMLDEGGKGKLESPGWREIYAYDSRLLAPCVGNDAVVAEKILIAVPVLFPENAEADIIFKLNLVNSASGENRAVSFAPKQRVRVADIEVQYLEVPTGPLPPGKYLLYVHVGDRATGQQVSAYLPLTIGD